MNVYFENKITNAKQQIKIYFTMKNSLDHLMKIAQDFYVISIGLNEINDGLKNPKRFKITILHLIFFGIFTFILYLFAALNYLYSLLNADFLPVYFRLLVIGFAIGYLWTLAIKIDLVLAEIKLNLNPFKIFYFLMNNIKAKHKLTDIDYNRLAILSRIMQTIILNYLISIISIISSVLIVSITIISQKYIWILLSIGFMPSMLISGVIASIWMSIHLILLSYYKLRFDQIHSSIKSIVQNGKLNVINKIKEKKLINLIEEHKTVSYEIHKLNLMFRRSSGVMSVVITFLRIIGFYLLINFNNNIFVNMLLIFGLFFLFIFGFGLTYLFSHQIKSAHQSNK